MNQKQQALLIHVASAIGAAATFLLMVEVVIPRIFGQ
jgi:hypothetical protein